MAITAHAASSLIGVRGSIIRVICLHESHQSLRRRLSTASRASVQAARPCR
jgi:hypothetical protein